MRVTDLIQISDEGTPTFPHGEEAALDGVPEEALPVVRMALRLRQLERTLESERTVDLKDMVNSYQRAEMEHDAPVTVRSYDIGEEHVVLALMHPLAWQAISSYGAMRTL